MMGLTFPSGWLKWGPMRGAIGALLVAAVTVTVTLVRAMQLSAVDVGTPPVLPNPSALMSPAVRPALNVDAIFARDVFATDREAPANRYLLVPEVEDTGPPGPPPARVQVLGIALADSGRSFATVQVGTDRPTIVRIGDVLGPYTVKSIAKKVVTFTTQGGGVLTITALTSGSGN